MNSLNNNDQQNLFYNWMSKRGRDDGTPYRDATIKAYITPLRSGLKKMIILLLIPTTNMVTKQVRIEKLLRVLIVMTNMVQKLALIKRPLAVIINTTRMVLNLAVIAKLQVDIMPTINTDEK